MRIFIKVKTGVKNEKIEKIDDSNFIVYVKERPVEGRANRAVIRALADYFNKPTSQFAILSGKTSKQKIVEIF
jgi:uncharacterized protein YggU (UPF0235/DUF167 family)